MSTETTVSPVEAPPARQSFFREHPRAILGIFLVLLVAAVGGFLLWRHYSVRESTDDAFIDSHIGAISARVGGHILSINVDQNQTVQAGTVLAQIDQRDYQVALQRALADLGAAQATLQAAQTNVPIARNNTSSQLAQARAAVDEAGAGVAVSERQVEAARARSNAAAAGLRESIANYQRASKDLGRYQELVQKDEISRQQYDTAVSAAAAAQAEVDNAKAREAEAQQAISVAESQVVASKSRVTQAASGVQAARTGPEQVAVSRAQAGSAEATVQLRRAAVEQARLNLEYTIIKAPFRAIVGRRNAEIGQNVQPGQPLFSLVNVDEVWVTANFKETQLAQMRPGQQVTISVDAYDREVRGHVDSIGAATGATFSMLPPQNSTGNFVKVVQRVPVKIVLEKDQDPQHLLRPGMSVTPTVLIQ